MSAPQREGLWAVRVGSLEEVVRKRGNPCSGSHIQGPGLSHPPLPLLGCVVQEEQCSLNPSLLTCQLALIPHPCWGPCERTCESTFGGGLVSGKWRPGPAPSQVPEISFLPGIHVGQNGDCEIRLTAHGTHCVLDSKQPQDQGLRSYPRPFRKQSVKTQPPGPLPQHPDLRCFLPMQRQPWAASTR